MQLITATPPNIDERPLRARATYGIHLALLTATAALISYTTASWLGLHEGFWAAISAVVVMQNDIVTTTGAGRDRFIGTAIGGVLGFVCATYWHQQIALYFAALVAAILICSLFRVSAAGRLSAVTITVIVLIPRNEDIWKVALFRFLEVTWGIAVAVGLQWLAKWAGDLGRKCRSAAANDLEKKD